MMEMDLLKSVGDYHQLFLKKLFQQLPHLYQQEYQYYFLLHCSTTRGYSSAKAVGETEVPVIAAPKAKIDFKYS